MSQKVLLVEDDKDLIQLLRFNLEREGFKVSYATDGSLALAELRRFVPDLLILDLMLPGTDGLEICRRCARQSSLPLSRSSSSQLAQRKQTGSWGSRSVPMTM